METKPSLSYVAQDYIRSHSLQCKLLIQAVEDQVFISITNQQQEVQYLENVALQDFLEETFFFENLKFESSLLLCIPETVDLMPFAEQELQQVFDRLLDAEDPTSIHQEIIPHTGITARFTVAQGEYAIRKKLGEIRLIPSCNMLIKQLKDLGKPEQKSIAIQVYPQEFELCYFHGEKFMYYKRFPMAGADDFNYFFLAVLEQFELATGEVHIYLSGRISQGDSLYQRLQKYSSSIAFIPVDIHLPESLSGYPTHELALLWGLSTCVSLEED